MKGMADLISGCRRTACGGPSFASGLLSPLPPTLDIDSSSFEMHALRRAQPLHVHSSTYSYTHA